MCPKSALPPHMQGDVDDVWAGTDNSSWLMRMKKRLQYIFAAGPRVPDGSFWKWRDIPITVFIAHGIGALRFESTDGTKKIPWDCYKPAVLVWRKPIQPYYLSRIQPWIRWHVSLQWPLFFNFHWIYRTKDVVKYPKYKSSFGIGKMITFGIGFKRDGDKVYWLTANGFGNFE